jgi:hypothetical protein
VVRVYQKITRCVVWAAASVLLAAAVGAAVPVRLVVVDSAGEAERILKQLRNGADFAVLAREKSTDATAVDGGYLGKIDPASLRPELRDALQGLRPGEISRVIKLPSGYALVKILADSELAKVDDAGRERQAAITSGSSVHYAPDLDGQSESVATLLQMPKPANWDQDPELICEVHKSAFATAMDRVDRMLDPNDEHSLARNNASPYDWVEAIFTKGNLYAYLGEMPKAIEQFEAAYKYSQAHLPQMVPIMEEALGIAYLQQSRMENDVFRDPGDRCLFPPSPGVRFAKTASSEKAI